MNPGADYRSAVKAAAERVREATGGKARYEEHILLPHFGGQIMVRFELVGETASPEELDELEKRFSALMPEGLLADFMGGVYRRAGYSFDALDARLRKCAAGYAGEEIPVSPFSDEVREEARALLSACGLDEDLPVWEIQPGEETELILLGGGSGDIASAASEGRRIHVSSAEKTACEGLMKAALHAKRNGISLMRAVEKAQIAPAGRPLATIEEVKKGTELADALLDFVQNCSWREAKDHIGKLIRNWEFTDWETIFAAVRDGRVIGMASVMKTDYYPLPDIFPWVSCIFVAEEHRGKGLPGELIGCANRYLARLGFERSYIPSGFFGLYERYGYRYVRDIVNYGGGTDHLFVKEFGED